jgi:hypothetical protein
MALAQAVLNAALVVVPILTVVVVVLAKVAVALASSKVALMSVTGPLCALCCTGYCHDRCSSVQHMYTSAAHATDTYATRCMYYTPNTQQRIEHQ